MADVDRDALYEAAGKLAQRSRAWHPDGRAEQLAHDVVDLVLADLADRPDDA